MPHAIVIIDTELPVVQESLAILQFAVSLYPKPTAILHELAGLHSMQLPLLHSPLKHLLCAALQFPYLRRRYLHTGHL